MLLEDDDAFLKVLSGSRDHARTPMQWNGLKKERRSLWKAKTLIARVKEKIVKETGIVLLAKSIIMHQQDFR